MLFRLLRQSERHIRHAGIPPQHPIVRTLRNRALVERLQLRLTLGLREQPLGHLKSFPVERQALLVSDLPGERCTAEPFDHLLENHRLLIRRVREPAAHLIHRQRRHGGALHASCSSQIVLDGGKKLTRQTVRPLEIQVDVLVEQVVARRPIRAFGIDRRREIEHAHACIVGLGEGTDRRVELRVCAKPESIPVQCGLPCEHSLGPAPFALV